MTLESEARAEAATRYASRLIEDYDDRGGGPR